MTGKIRSLLKEFPPLSNKYIGSGALDMHADTYAVIPEGKDFAARRYTDGSEIRRRRFRISGRLCDGKGQDTDNLRFMQSISDYLCGVEYPDDIIIGFEQVSPPTGEMRGSNTAAYSFSAEVIYKKQ